MAQEYVALDDLDTTPPLAANSAGFGPADWRELTVLCFNAVAARMADNGSAENNRSSRFLFKRRPRPARIDVDSARIKALAGVVRRTKADVLAFQGLYRRGEVEALRDALRSAYPNAALKPSPGGMAMGNGLLVLSRYPFWHIEFHAVETGSFDDDLFPEKGFLRVGIDGGAFGRFWMATFDAGAGRLSSPKIMRKAVKLQQRLTRHVLEYGARRDGEFPVVVTGNLGQPWTDAPEGFEDPYIRMVGAGFFDAYETAAPGHASHRWSTRTPLHRARNGAPPPRPARDCHILLHEADARFVQAEAARTLFSRTNNKVSPAGDRPISDRDGILVRMSRRFGSGSSA